MYNILLKGTWHTQWEQLRAGEIECMVYDPWNGGLKELLREALEKTGAATPVRTINRVLEEWTEEFALVVRAPDRKLYAFVDHIQSHPLFYTRHDGIFYLTDDPQSLPDSVLDHFEEANIQTFLLCSYTLGNRTLCGNLYQMPAGTFLKVEAGEVNLRTYYDYWNRSEGTFDGEIRKKAFRELLLGIIRDFTQKNTGRQIVLMLSAGYDSRLLLWLLDRAGAENVLLCSYGRRWQRDVVWARKFAMAAGYPWVFVPHNFTTARKTFQSKAFQSYYRETHQYFRKPFDQDVRGILGLKERELLKDNAIFITGMSGDFISGGHLTPGFVNRPDVAGCADLICAKHFRLWKWEGVDEDVKKLVENQIRSDLEQAPSPGHHPESLYEWWEWRERQSKLVMGTIREFEWFGHRVFLPLWNKKVMRFFEMVPAGERLSQKFYREFCEGLTLRNGTPFTAVSHTVPEKEAKPLPRIRRALEYFLKPHWGSCTFTEIGEARDVAERYLSTRKLDFLPVFHGISSALLVKLVMSRES